MLPYLIVGFLVGLLRVLDAVCIVLGLYTRKCISACCLCKFIKILQECFLHLKNHHVYIFSLATECVMDQFDV